LEGRQWEYDADGNVVYTADYVEKRTKIPNYNAIEGIGTVGWMCTHRDITSRLLQLVITQADRQRSVDNIRGYQVAKLDPINVVIPGEVELAKQPLIENAYKQMIIRAVSADSAVECEKVLEAWPKQLEDLGYEEWVQERTRQVEEMFGIE
jgi:hypothetical protein